MTASQRYRIARRLRQDDAGELYEAFVVGDEGFERRVALRLLRGLTPADGAAWTRFVDDSRDAAARQHPGIVAVVDFGVADDTPFQVLEYVDGQTIAPGPHGIPPETAITVTAEVARALAYTHRPARGHRPLVHGAVSPSSILLAWTGEVKLTGFGWPLAPDRRPGSDLAFAAPEVLAGRPPVPASDLFALGCILHWLLTGTSALDDASARARVQAGAVPTIEQRLPADLIALLERALAPHPDQRFASAEVMAEACEAARARRTRGEPKAQIREFLRSAGHRAPGEPLRPEVELVLRRGDAPLRRFASVPPAPTPSGTVQPDPAGPDGQIEPAGADELVTALVEPGEALATALAIEASPAPAPHDSSEDRGPRPSLASATPTPSDGDGDPVEDGDDPLIGTVLHGYQIERRLGRGALARVYRARHLVLDHHYAVKVLYGAAAANERAQERLRREAQTLSRLRHPNIVTVVDFGTTPRGLPFLTMELLEGQTLRRVIKNEAPLAGPRIARISRQIADALAYAHGQAVVHRDVKPSNVMLAPTVDGREQVKVVDFGIARIHQPEGTRLTSTDALLGTPRYMAPEQITGASDVGPAADLYALGMMMYAMLAGDAPFVGATLDVVEKQLAEKPRPLTTDTGLEPLVMALLEKQPELRPASGRAVMEAIDRLGLSDETAIAEPILPPTTAATQFRAVDEAPMVPVATPGPRWWLYGAVAAGVAIGSATVTAMVLSQSPPVSAPVAAPLAPAPASPPAPRARPASEVQPTPPPVAPSESTTDAAEQPRPRPPTPRSRTVDLSAKLTAARQRVARSGLTKRDVREEPALQAALEDLARAVRAGRPSAVRQAEAALDRALRGALTDARVERRLKDLSERLRRAADRVPPEVMTRLEDRYFDLRTAVDGDPAQRLRAVAALEADLARALRSPGPRD